MIKTNDTLLMYLSRVFSIFPFLLLFYVQSNAQQQETIWIEAEDFNDLGGWTNDWQFIDQMGSPYLLSIGYGTPVQEAITKVKVNQSGYYRMWVRTHDWQTTHHPGQFNVVVDNNPSLKTFGRSGYEKWTWEDGGKYYLNDSVSIKLKDLTGYYGRCDAIVFASDTNWIPPVKKEDIAPLRIKYGSISQEIKNTKHYDVVVIGGGVAGTLAAVSASRQGAKTVLIQNRGQLGGNASHEIMVPPVGTRMTLLNEDEKKLDPRETGLIEEVATYGPQKYFEAGKQFPSRLLRLAESEPNLDLFLYTHATDVEMETDNKIKSIVAMHVPTSELLRFFGTIFVDCTGNGIIGVKAGADYRHGKESKAMHNETKAVENANNNTLGSSLKHWYIEEEQPQSFTTPSWAYHFPHCSDFGVQRHLILGKFDSQWMIELGGTNKTYTNAEDVRDDLLRLIYGIWDHAKNYCTELKDAAKNKKLVWVSHVVGVRESYRLMGDYILTELDVTEQPLLQDRVAYGGWGLDEHPSEGFFYKERINNDTHSGVLHSIPYRSLYSRNINNLMMAGRDISATHVALTGTRVMYTCGAIGQAVGMAAGICIEKNTTPRNIYKNHLEELQQSLLKTGAYIIELPNLDPDDKALKASATASSEFTPASNVINGFARATLPTAYSGATLKTNAWKPDPNQKGPRWLQLSWSSPQKFNVMHLTFQNRRSLAPKKILIEQFDGKTWKKIKEVDNTWESRRLVIPVGKVKAKDLRIVFDESLPGLGICEIRVYHESKSNIEIIKRANQISNIPDGEILLPWEDGYVKDQGNGIL